jgi:hypothetical protein
MIPLPDRLAMKLIVAIGCALLLALLIHDRNHWKAKTAHYAELLAAERGAHSATVAGYRAAATQARAADSANAARVKAEQAAINERTADEYQNRIAAARAAAGSLRRTTAAAADSGRGGAAPVPGLSAAAARASQTAGEDGLPDPDALIATEQAIQLDELINWVKAQSEVEAGGR